MRKKIYKILVTGGAGFIGSAFVKQALKERHKVIVLDKLTYAGDLRRLKLLKYNFYRGDVCCREFLEMVLKKEKPDVIVNFAAETHVDRSIEDATPFIATNIIGTRMLLEAALKYKTKKFIHISTDEVYGEVKKGSFSEDSPLNPSSPYSATKAAADLLIKSYMRTYNLPVMIVRPCNTYGPWQYPEKLIPLAILRLLKNMKIPVYARGTNIREWLYVDDCAKGIMLILERGKSGQTYNLGSGEERKNIEIVSLILHNLKKSKEMVQFVKDRPGHDIRYRLNANKLYKLTKWRPETKLNKGIKITLDWAILHKDWVFSKYKEVSRFYR